MLCEETVQKSLTSITKVVFPGETNHYDTLFGGQALNWMDEIAFITATRYGRKSFVTVSSDKIDFKNSIPGGSIIELKGQVTQVKRSSLIVNVCIYKESMFEHQRELAVEGNFTLVALDENNKPIAIHS